MEGLKVGDIVKAAHDLYIKRITGLIKENEELKVYKVLYEEIASTDVNVMEENVKLWNKVKDLEKVIKCYERNGTPF